MCDLSLPWASSNTHFPPQSPRVAWDYMIRAHFSYSQLCQKKKNGLKTAVMLYSLVLRIMTITAACVLVLFRAVPRLTSKSPNPFTRLVTSLRISEKPSQ